MIKYIIPCGISVNLERYFIKQIEKSSIYILFLFMNLWEKSSPVAIINQFIQLISNNSLLIVF